MPLEGLKESILPTFTRMEMLDVLTQDKIDLVSPGEKLKKACSVYLVKYNSSMSKAFS